MWLWPNLDTMPLISFGQTPGGALFDETSEDWVSFGRHMDFPVIQRPVAA
jgi:hypothetical protein